MTARDPWSRMDSNHHPGGPTDAASPSPEPKTGVSDGIYAAFTDSVADSPFC
jgi:hypothetical protein